MNKALLTTRMARSCCSACFVLLVGCGGGGGESVAAPLTQPDSEPPVVALAAPRDLAANLNGVVVLAANASDNIGVAAVEFQVDGMPLGAEDTSAPFEASVDTADHAAGQHVVRTRARDAAGNRSPWVLVTVHFGGDRALPRGFSKTEGWITGLANATTIAEAPDGRLFIAEQGGALRVAKADALLAAPFRRFDVDAAGERGLLGVALHPDFAFNGWVYAYYTTRQGGTHNRISRLVASGDLSDGSETVIVDLPPLSAATNHNGGALHFGPDRKLYVAVGENANGPRAQNLADPFGKLLRLNDDGSIPPDNPFFATQTGLGRAVWAYGLRNPFRFAFDPVSGRMHINDVGAATWEEINVGVAGANYGWPASEGPDNLGAGISAPLFAYRQTATLPPGTGLGGFFTGRAITGGAFYPAGGRFPAAYHGSYFFADFASRFVARLDTQNDNAAYAFAQLAGLPVDLLVARDGALLVLTRSAVTRIVAD